MPKLDNAGHERFCNEYIYDLNVTAAYARAKWPDLAYENLTPKQKGASSASGSRLLAKKHITKRVRELMAARSKRTEITQDKVLRQMARLAFSDIRDYYDNGDSLLPITQLDDDAAAALTKVKATKRRTGEYDENDNPIYEDIVEISLAEKRAALELLGKHLGMFTDKVEIVGIEALADRLTKARDRATKRDS